MKTPDPIPSPIVVGRIVGHHGLHGWVKLESYTRPREQINEYQTILLGKQGAWRKIDVERYKTLNRGLLVKLYGYSSREHAEHVIGSNIAIEHGQLAELPKGEFYWTELIGLSVVNLQGIEFGTVNKLMETGANDVLVIGSDEKECLIPWIPDVVTEVELSEKLIVVNWQEDYL